MEKRLLIYLHLTSLCSGGCCITKAWKNKSKITHRRLYHLIFSPVSLLRPSPWMEHQNTYRTFDIIYIQLFLQDDTLNICFKYSYQDKMCLPQEFLFLYFSGWTIMQRFYGLPLNNGIFPKPTVGKSYSQIFGTYLYFSPFFLKISSLHLRSAHDLQVKLCTQFITQFEVRVS